jgi:hypothetical protein
MQAGGMQVVTEVTPEGEVRVNRTFTADLTLPGSNPTLKVRAPASGLAPRRETGHVAARPIPKKKA